MNVNLFNPEWTGYEKKEYSKFLKYNHIPTEKGFSKYVQNNTKLYFSSCGKSSLYAILKSYNVGADDEVIIPCYCCESVAYPIKHLQAEPILADIDVFDLNVSVDSIRNLISPKTKAIVVPSLYGNPANITEITEEVEDNILIINDLAQAYGATLNCLPMECYGDAGFFSCGPGKQLTGAGGSVFWLNNNVYNAELKDQNILKNKILHKSFYRSRVNIDENIHSPFYRCSSITYKLLNLNECRVNKNATSLDLNVMLMLMKNYSFKLKQKRIIMDEIKNLSKNKAYRIISEQRGTGSPIKIVLLFNSVELCNDAKRVLNNCKIYFSNGYKKINGTEKITLNGYNKVLDKIVEVPLEIEKKQYILDALNQIN